MPFLERFREMFQPRESEAIRSRRLYSLLAEILVTSMHGSNVTGKRIRGPFEYVLGREERTIRVTVNNRDGVPAEFMGKGSKFDRVSYVISRNVEDSVISASNSQREESVSMVQNPEAFKGGLEYLEQEGIPLLELVFAT